MKKVIFLSLLLWVLAACQKKDIRELRGELNRQKDLIAQLQSALQTINTDIKGLQAIATALQAKISVVSYTATTTGYELTMSDGSKIYLTNGKNGTNGANGTNGKDGVNAPPIGLRQDTDGNYYWTMGGDWLLQNGQKVKANGTNGANGSNGVNGITPLLMINATSNQWMVSYDNGNTWSAIKDGNGNPITATGATGPQGPAGTNGTNGIPGFGITETDAAIVIIYNGSAYTLPKGSSSTAIYKVIMVADLPLSEKLAIMVDAAPSDRADVWIDLNNNKVQNTGEKINSFGTFVEYPLNVSKTVTIYGKITALNCGSNWLVFLDVSGNNALTELKCGPNRLETLDVSKNTQLRVLNCSDNFLRALDVSQNVNLTSLTCDLNDLRALNVSNNIHLTALSCRRNQIKNANMTVLINSLPASDIMKEALIIETPYDENTMPTTAELNAAKAKKWKVLNNGVVLNP